RHTRFSRDWSSDVCSSDLAMWPLVIACLAALTVALPAISPRRFAIQPFAGVYGAVMLAIQGAMLLIGMTALLAGAGYAVPVSTEIGRASCRERGGIAVGGV